MKYITAQEILVMHKLVVDATGGLQGIRDLGLLQSVVARPKTEVFGRALHPTVFSKAAAYLESIARHHVFIDGNKRTSITVAARFLFINGYQLAAANEEVENFVLRVATEKLEISDIARWFKKYSRTIR